MENEEKKCVEAAQKPARKFCECSDVRAFVIALLTSLIVGVIGAPKTRGKSLDQITKERYGNIID